MNQREVKAPDCLHMELLTDPLAVESVAPRVGWVVNDRRLGSCQTAYHIAVYDLDFGMNASGKMMWDSGKVESPESSSVVYGGAPLAPNQAYAWRVRVWNQLDEVSSWSEYQRFTTAVKDGWLAKPIWGLAKAFMDVSDDFVFLRKTFDLPDKEIALAIAHVTALSPEPANQYVYRLRINGEFIGAGPPRAYAKGKIMPVERIPTTRDPEMTNRYNSFDVTAQLRTGDRNAVGALCYTQDDKRFLFQMHIRFADGSEEVILSDESWKAIPAGNRAIVDQGNETCWFHYAPREGIDARQYPFGWDTPAFDDSEWTEAVVKEPIANLTSSATPNTCQYGHAPQSIVKKDNGHYFIDFGKSHVAGILLDVHGTDGQEVEIRLGEELSEPDVVMYKMRTGNHYREVWTLKEGPQRLQHWGYRVFRYAELLNVPEPFDETNIRAMELRQPFDDEASSFSSSDTILNDVWEMCRYTIKSQALDMYVDTHTRERINYETGIFSQQISDYAVHGQYAFPRFSIEHPYYRPSWPLEGKLQSVMMAWLDYQYTGNPASLKQHYDVLKTKTLEKFINSDYLVEKERDAEGQHGPYGRDMVDWPLSELDGFEFTSINTVVNAFHYRAIADLASMANVLGREEDAAHYERLAEKLRRAINTHLFDEAAGKFKDGKQAGNYSMHANAIPLSLGIVDDAHRSSVVDFIASRGMVGSVYIAQLLLDALYLNHRADAALAILNSTGLRSWGNMLYKLNATVAGEAWDPSLKKNMSFSHPWGAAPANVIVRGLFGIQPLEPGFSRFQIKPQPASLEWAELTTPCIKGCIRAAFQQHKGELDVKVQIPANTTARVSLPVREGDQVTMNGDPVEGTVEKGFFTMNQVCSGNHVFHVRAHLQEHLKPATMEGNA
jgi:alpha-L-rhamnosidase